MLVKTLNKANLDIEINSAIDSRSSTILKENDDAVAIPSNFMR